MYLYQCYVIVYVTSYFIADQFQNWLQNVLLILYKKLNIKLGILLHAT